MVNKEKVILDKNNYLSMKEKSIVLVNLTDSSLVWYFTLIFNNIVLGYT